MSAPFHDPHDRAAAPQDAAEQDLAAAGDPWGGRHPKDRSTEPEDPMLFTAEPVAGDPEQMLVALVEEFARQGFDAAHVMRLFETPFFRATWGLRQLYGVDGVRERVDATLARCGVLRFRTTHAAGGAPADPPATTTPRVATTAPHATTTTPRVDTTAPHATTAAPRADEGDTDA